MPDDKIKMVLDDVSREATEIAQHAATEAAMTMHRICTPLPGPTRAIAFGAAAALLQDKLERLLTDVPPEGVPACASHRLMVAAYRNSLAAIRKSDGKAEVELDIQLSDEGDA